MIRPGPWRLLPARTSFGGASRTETKSGSSAACLSDVLEAELEKGLRRGTRHGAGRAVLEALGMFWVKLLARRLLSSFCVQFIVDEATRAQ